MSRLRYFLVNDGVISNYVSAFVGCVLLTFTTSAIAGGRIFMVPHEADPNEPVWGQDFEITLDRIDSPRESCFSIHIDVDPNEEVKAVQVSFPCQVLCSGSGNVEIVVEGGACYFGVDTSRQDDFLEGYTSVTFPPVDHGDCVEPDIRLPRFAVARAGPPLGPAIPVVTDMPYVGQVPFRISSDCTGTAHIELPNEPDCAMRDENNQPIPFITNGVVFNIPAGRCCSATGCFDGINAIACREAQGLNAIFVPNATCDEPCCVVYSDCDDADACTFQQCSNTYCDVRPTRFGDVNGSGGAVHLDDLLCAISGFGNINDCPTADIWPNCTGNGIVTGDDLFAVIQAFGGIDPCGCGE